MDLLLDFYGLQVFVETQSPRFQAVVANLKSDFEFFVSQSIPIDPIRISLSATEPFEVQAFKGFALPLFRTRRCKAFGWNQRYCDFGENHGVYMTNPFEHFVFGSDLQRIYEIVYALILSRIGEELESQNGWLRLHALAFSQDNEGTLVLFPPGGGKSVLALQVLETNNSQLLGDDMIFTDGETLYPFPIRLALKEEALLWAHTKDLSPFKRKIIDAHKYLMSIPPHKISQPVPFQKMFLGQKSSKTGLSALTVWDRFRFVAIQVLGWGLPQMREFMIRGDNWRKYPIWAHRRFLLSMKLLKKVPNWHLSSSHTEKGRDELFEILNLKPTPLTEAGTPLKFHSRFLGLLPALVSGLLSFYQ